MARDLAQIRGTLPRGIGEQAPSASDASDPYAATAAIGSTQAATVLPRGLPLSPDFDSAAGLESLRRRPAAAPMAAPRNSRWLAWATAYLLATAGALAIALR
jgi:hypothetical protein